MSAMRVRTFDNKSGYAPAGPGLNAPTLYKLGWLTNDRVLKYIATPTSSAVTLDLVALNVPGNQGYLMALIQSSNHAYTVEFQRPIAWDAGIIRDGFSIHELRSN
jgi:hypothetical protein